MNLLELTNLAACLVNQASERAGAGFPDQARIRLVELRQLLNDPSKLGADRAPEGTEKSQSACAD